jgi:Icc-related predicted phosphoesterase
MNIQVVSDLHLDHGRCHLPKIDRDLLIITGDLDLSCQGWDFLKEQLDHSPVIFILGNHDFYNPRTITIKNQNEIQQYWSEIQQPGFYYLENKAVHLHGVWFLGCTLWTDFNHGNKYDMKTVQRGLADCSYIYENYELISPESLYIQHLKSRHWLESQMEKLGNQPMVVLTHHLPSYQSVGKQFQGSSLNSGFASDIDDLILKYHPKLWIHGHTHLSFDYHIGKTRILCNPRGYINNIDENKEFNPNLLIQV